MTDMNDKQTPQEPKTENEVQKDAAQAAPSENDATDDIEALKAKLAEAERKAQENYELALRVKAEAENQRKRMEREAENSRRFALERFVTDLVPVLDSMEQGLAIEVKDEAAKAMREGLELTMKLLLDVMKKHGVERVDPKGQPFNPEHHEAMSMVESTEVDPHHVLEVYQKGYLLNGRVVRPARVVVSKGSPKVDESA